MKLELPELNGQILAAFPCSQNKKPLTPHGFKDATSDPNKFRQLLRGFADPLIGVPTGVISGFDVLDIDPDGLDWLKERIDLLGDTRWHRTPRGGYHILFKHAPNLSCSASRIASGIDVRADGGYIIWWPSFDFPSSNHNDLADWPKELLELASAPTIPVHGHDGALNFQTPPSLTTSYTSFDSCWNELSNSSYEEPVVDEIVMEISQLGEELSHIVLAVPIVKKYSRESKYVVRAAIRTMLRLEVTRVGTRNDTLNAESYSIGRLMAKNWTDSRFLVRALLRGAITSKLVKDDGYESVQRTIISGLVAGMRKPYRDLCGSS